MVQVFHVLQILLVLRRYRRMLMHRLQARVIHALHLIKNPKHLLLELILGVLLTGAAFGSRAIEECTRWLRRGLGAGLACLSYTRKNYTL